MQQKAILGSIGPIIAAALLCGALGVFGQSTVSLNVSSATYTISKALYGVLMENYGRCIYGGVYVGTTSSIPNTSGMRNDVIEGFKEAGVGCIEWPGGCFADQYHWQDGTTSPQSSRPGGEMQNGLGTPEFYKLCSLTTAYAYPTANIQSGTSAEMNAWLNYINQRPHWWAMTPFWKIGNEEWNPCGNMTQSQYQTKYEQFYAAEPAWAKEQAMHILDGGSGGGWISADCQYAVQKSGPMGISLHRYSVTDWNNKGSSSSFTESQYYQHLGTAWGTNSAVNQFVNSMNTIDPNYKVALCVDEWGAWYADVSGLGTSFNWSTVRDAIIAGMHLNIFNNQCRRVKMALVAQPVNVIQSLMVTENGGSNRMRKTPVFWVFKMFKPHQGAKMIPATVNTTNNQNIPIITASASINAANQINVSLVNTHATSTHTVTINLSNLPAGMTVSATGWKGQIVNGPSITSGITSFTATDTASLAAFTGFTVSGASISVTMPAHSVVMISSDASGLRTDAAGTRHGVPSITAVAGGKIVVRFAEMPNAPVRLTLYGIDGRTVLEQHTGTLKSGCNQIVWQPKKRSAGTNTYIVKMESGDFTTSQRVVLTRS